MAETGKLFLVGLLLLLDTKGNIEVSPFFSFSRYLSKFYWS
jgi:hypothetical protein